MRTQLAHAYEALGDAVKALTVYRPVFERKRDFASYALVKRLTAAVSNVQGEIFTADTIAELQEKLLYQLEPIDVADEMCQAIGD